LLNECFQSVVVILAQNLPLIHIREIVHAVAKELHIIYEKKFFRKWYSIVSYMMEVLEIITEYLQTGDLEMKDRQRNILEIVRMTLGDDSMEKLKTKYQTTPENEIEYVSFLSYLSFYLHHMLAYVVIYQLRNLQKYKINGSKEIMKAIPTADDLAREEAKIELAKKRRKTSSSKGDEAPETSGSEDAAGGNSAVTGARQRKPPDRFEMADYFVAEKKPRTSRARGKSSAGEKSTSQAIDVIPGDRKSSPKTRQEICKSS
jgi:hypothetical protein